MSIEQSFILNETKEEEPPSNKNSHLASLREQLEIIKDILVESMADKNEDRIRETRELRYQYAAIVIDRFFFFLAIFYFVVVFCSLILSIPNFYKFS